jgi:hypothetical protein
MERVSDEEANAAVEQCDSQFAASRGALEPVASAEIADCLRELGCDDIEDFDDICFASVAADWSETLLPQAIHEACTVSDTARCEAALRAMPDVTQGVIGDCYRRYLACADAEDWVSLEDRCLSLSLLTEPAQQQLVSCLDMTACDAVVTCMDVRGALSW